MVNVGVNFHEQEQSEMVYAPQGFLLRNFADLHVQV